ncbi:SIT4 phosphatase-associated protein-domain-containing protein [Bombardia bombarda]|uniref:SIT4 phosphatase-associated protein-domain-containing protein n=1 Tax=Bombardia bombarda TaxID=252184 RepID=A0AA39TWB0_9PEZI|nr:SIT4 phosphatase-associated protein-domain-containing protein [Bombardia bombarda]
MFWRFGGYANISTIDTILEKENFTLEELLDEADLIQELKQHNAKLVEYLRDQNVLEKLLKYVIAPRLEPVAAPNDDDEEEDVEGKGKSVALFSSRPRASSNTSSRATDMSSDDGAIEKKRNRYAFVASEILSSDNWSIYESVMESRDLLRQFWQFLKRPTPLDPLQASYFTKVNESLFDKKTEDMLALLKSLDGAVPDMLKHVDCPMIMDLLLRIISLERTESGQGTVEWLYTQDVMPTLLSFLGPEHSWATQTSAGDFLKAIITVSANASQNEQTCIGPNELTRQLVSKPCVKQLIKYMLGGGNPLTCGVGIIIEVIRKNNSDYDPDGASPNSLPSSRDPIYLGTLLRLFAQHIPDFMNLIMNVPAQQDRKLSTFGKRIEPLGFDRFKTCELMAELLHCSNMGLLNEPGSEEFIAARDAQRQRMREEGRFMPLRVDEPPSTEDLTMRSTQSTAATEGRRLEVTNSSVEDDGFEEVTADDSTHGIEELPEGSAPISSTSLDDDDFVDESLDSSPRFEFAKLETSKHDNSQDFEHSDLVVRPLSPTKKAAEDAENSAAIKAADADKSPAKEAASFTKEKQSQEQTAKSESCESSELEGDGKPSTTTRTETALPVTTLESDPIKAPQLAEATAEKSSTSGDISPRPEDTPAPLFSGQGAPAAPSQAPAKDDTTQPKETTSPNVVEVVGESAETSATEIKTKQPQGVEVSIVVDPVDDETILLDESQKAVVGDFLKMKFVEYDVVPTILRFFFAHPWNNFLHNVVYDIVQQVFNGPMDRGYNPTLAISLFEAADITNQIINGQRASEKSEREHKTRMGYMGHLTLIAEEVVKFTERNPPELLKNDTVMDKVMAQEWINYVEGPLAETRERDNAILGGVRPEVASNNRAQASSLASAGLVNISSTALQEAGLMGSQHLSDNSGGGEVGPFAISSGTTLSSGFGSSSDEEDDEEQENEEDVNNEVRRTKSHSKSHDPFFINSSSFGRLVGPSGSKVAAPSLPTTSAWGFSDAPGTIFTPRWERELGPSTYLKLNSGPSGQNVGGRELSPGIKVGLNRDAAVKEPLPPAVDIQSPLPSVFKAEPLGDTFIGFDEASNHIWGRQTRESSAQHTGQDISQLQLRDGTADIEHEHFFSRPGDEYLGHSFDDNTSDARLHSEPETQQPSLSLPPRLRRTLSQDPFCHNLA